MGPPPPPPPAVVPIVKMSPGASVAPAQPHQQEKPINIHTPKRSVNNSTRISPHRTRPVVMTRATGISIGRHWQTTGLYQVPRPVVQCVRLYNCLPHTQREWARAKSGRWRLVDPQQRPMGPVGGDLCQCTANPLCWPKNRGPKRCQAPLSTAESGVRKRVMKSGHRKQACPLSRAVLNGRRRGGGVWDPKGCVPKMARSDFPSRKFRFCPRWSLWYRGGGGQGFF